ncbi:MAG: ATP phosphoribosyltransferase [Dehalococcoidales bacterium]|nr:ATP phosphoribosyltransferase [Dehalococcoidales bacterium]MDZ4230821.1 ATP phosphoribosyltransferase [Dehalococcoidales bacterium]
MKIALPKGRLLPGTAALLERADWGLSSYQEGMRSYRLTSLRFPDLFAKVFHEKDIPVQVAVGNYDLGICGLDWVEELLVKYPSSALVKIRKLGYGEGALYVVAARGGVVSDPEEIQGREELIRLASEYPNLAESFALERRLRRFSVFPLWGAAEAYPPDSADLALISGGVNEESFNHGLVPVSDVLAFSAVIIANKDSWETKDLSRVLASLDGGLPGVEKRSMPVAAGRERTPGAYPAPQEVTDDAVRLALPDGHQQSPTVKLLNKAGMKIDDYPSATGNRRPSPAMEGVTAKVIRPQDMPLQVANGNFDLAITGKDWLTEHLYQFPSSPVTELLDLKFGWVKIVAVVCNDLPVTEVAELKSVFAGRGMPIRVASEYINIADKCARDNHLGRYRVVPTWGATEAFLPEDADLLIENTETGGTIARHNLKIIDTMFESTARLIGNRDSVSSPAKRQRIKSITEILRKAVED